MLDVRRMKVLKEVAAQGSFSAAAEALSFTQSAVSQQVAALERESGAKLVERRARGIRLTPAGEALVSHADAILARLDDAEQELAAIAGLKGGRVRVASFQSAGATLVPKALGEFHRRHADVELSASTAELTEARDLLRAGGHARGDVHGFRGPPPPHPPAPPPARAGRGPRGGGGAPPPWGGGVPRRGPPPWPPGRPPPPPPRPTPAPPPPPPPRLPPARSRSRASVSSAVLALSSTSAW